MRDIKVTDAQLYTTRWHLMEIARKSDDNKVDSLAINAMQIISDMLGEDLPKEFRPPEVDIPDPNGSFPLTNILAHYNKKQLWYPEAIKSATKLVAQGTHPDQYPNGLVVHFLSGRFENKLVSAHDAISYAKDMGYMFDAMATTGEIVQAAPLNQWGNHAGVSGWTIKGKKVSNVSKYLRGIELCNGSKLSVKNGKYYTWFNVEIPKSNVVYISKKTGNMQVGYYQKFEPVMVQRLMNYALWLKLNNPSVFDLDLVVGHDEVAGTEGIGYDRKPDPGGAMPMTMVEFRSQLKSEWEIIVKELKKKGITT